MIIIQLCFIRVKNSLLRRKCNRWMIVLILLIHKSSKVESIFFSIFFLAAATIPNIDQWFRVCTKMSEGNDLSARYSEIMKRLPADNGLSQ